METEPHHSTIYQIFELFKKLDKNKYSTINQSKNQPKSNPKIQPQDESVNKEAPPFIFNDATYYDMDSEFGDFY